MNAAREPAERVTAVVVAYRPEPARFARVLAALATQVASVVVVDNAQGAGLDGLAVGGGLERLDMHGNAGIAAAQNAGLRHAYARGASHVLLLDHDSIPAPGMVAALLDAWRRLAAEGVRVAAVGANPADPRRPGHGAAFVRIAGGRVRRVAVHDEAALLELPYLIGSGSLIGAAAYAAIGPMDERLFIDYVDTEWGLRAGQLGWRCVGVPAARLDHTLGDAPAGALGSAVSRHSPLRNYYIVRNLVWLLRASRLPAHWKFAEGTRSIARTAAWLLFMPPRGERLRAVWRGLRDGLRGRLGAAGG